MSEIWFYHLTSQTLESTLPQLLERALARGWRAVVEAVDEERIEALDVLLWTCSDESFIAHGRVSDGDPDMQPIFLTCGPENPNGASVRFFVGGAAVRPEIADQYERIILIFDGNDEGQLEAARIQWRALKQLGAAISYWRQSENGRWTKMD